jgi:dephospho-CoA kinase
MLYQLGAALIDSDLIARTLTSPHGDAMGEIVRTFGTNYLDHEGGLDRAKMRQLVFNDPQAKLQLETIVHPLVGLHTARQAQIAAANGARLVVYDVPLLVESKKWAPRLHSIVVVDCPEHLQIERVMLRNGLDRSAVQRVIAVQASRSQRRAAADIVIDNGEKCSLLNLQQLASETVALFGL